MQLPIFEKYIDELIEKSTLDVPAWNIEKAREGKAAGWNYIDGCMILALLEIYNATGEKKYYEFADAFIDHRVQEDGTITKYSVEEYNIDNVNAGDRPDLQSGGDAAPHRGGQLLAQEDLPQSGMAGRHVYGTALLHGV